MALNRLNATLFRTVVAPEYAAKTDDELEPFAAEAELEIAPSKWGKFEPRALALMTAHLLKMGDISAAKATQSSGSRIKKTKVGDLSREYQMSGKNDDSLDLTTYGEELKRLRKRILKGPIFVGC